MLCLFEIICFLIMCFSFLWMFWSFMEEEPFQIMLSITLCIVTGYFVFSDKTKNLEFEVFEDRMNVYSVANNNEPFRLNFNVKTVEDEDGNIFIATGGEPRLSFYVDSADGNGRELVTMFADSITMKKTAENEVPYITLTYKYVKTGNFWYKASKQPFENKVWWTLYLPDNAIVKEQ